MSGGGVHTEAKTLHANHRSSSEGTVTALALGFKSTSGSRVVSKRC